MAVSTFRTTPFTDDRGDLRRAVARFRSALQTYGWFGAVRLLATRAGRLVYLSEAYVWYWLDLSARGSHVASASGPTLAEAGERKGWACERLPVGNREAESRRRFGVELWMAAGYSNPFACWVYHQDFPASPVPGGVVRLPSGVVGVLGLWELRAVPGSFGRFGALAGWPALADALARRGVGSILTRVEETDLPGRRAIERAGFSAVASMRFERIGGRARVDVRAYEPNGIGELLALQLMGEGGVQGTPLIK